MTEEEVYKLARNAALVGLSLSDNVKGISLVAQRVEYLESCLVYLNETIKERWPEDETRAVCHSAASTQSAPIAVKMQAVYNFSRCCPLGPAAAFVCEVHYVY